ncbi:ATP-binding response regulator [Vibrio quintilis]|nr:hybrid sensor histidine kinase/response regulator [Vibrio quintilis]
MCIFIVSATIIQVGVTTILGDFSLTWIPPTLSISEMFFMGYGLITSRFYSSRYMLYLLLANLITGFVLYLPLLTVVEIDNHHFNLIVFYVLLTGFLWKTVSTQIKPYISLLFYGSHQTPSEKINGLIDEFKHSPHDALEKLAQLLNVPENRIQLVKKSPDDELFDTYFSKHKDVLILEELLDKINTTKGKETLDRLHKKMNQTDAAFIMPMFNSSDTVSHLLISTHKNNGKLFSAEELTALKRVFREAQFYINADLQLKQAQSLAHSIAHEMRNPLTQLQLHFEKLQIKVEENKQDKDILEEISHGKATIERGKQLINMILREVSHSSLAQESMSVSSVNRLLLQAINQFGFESDAIKSRVNLRTDTDFSVRANDTLFNFVVFNLLRNAIYYFDAYPASTIEISTHLNPQNNTLIFRDTGPGIPDHVQKQIFEDFYSYHKHGGSGLGLSYCKRVMNSFGGTIECHSQYGKFTEFHLIFPSLSLEPLPAGAEQTGPEKDTRPENQLLSYQHNAKDKTILVVDDNKMQRTLVQLFLQQLGYQIMHADNGKAALDLFRNNAVDLVIMDIQMPVMNGFEATTKIKDISPETPVIALSGESGDKELQLIHELMDGRLTKPTSKSELQTMLKQCFINHQQQAEATCEIHA